ncbi:MAG TPA: porin [Flavobacterium sp.]|uniref:porin n=1 Tax=Flavobacterium sp. TaxID=239 RepID=UPI002DBCD03F|nr:porin [Flavobacterium sp.]HEU4791313.1 porin [Flavobacterium sp.]
MKKVIVAIMISICGIVNAQEVENDSIKKVSIDSLTAIVNEHSMKLAGYEEKFSGLETIANELNKIKVSGYIQAQYEAYDTWSSDGTIHGIPVSGSTSYEDNSFYIRRARIKFTYKPVEGVNFVLQPNFEVHQVTLKDAYVQLNDRWLNTFSLWVGQFNRPTYEIEYSSASREFAERTLMTRTLYPTERDQGAKLEADFVTQYNFPLKLQFAILNGNFGEGSLASQAKDVDNAKDLMARGVYSLKMMNNSLGIDFGAHTYLGKTTVIAQTTPPTVFSDVNNNPFTPKVGDKLNKELFGGEVQAYYDFLGGMSLKGEYIRGTYSGTTNVAQVNSLFNANKVRNVEGYYISFVKNVGKVNTASIRYDVFDPNTKMSGDAVTSAGDLRYNTWTYAWQYFFNDNIKIMACYLMPLNEKSQNAGADFKNDKHDNTFTLRVQARF